MNTYKHLARSIIFITVCLFVTPMTVHSQSEPSKCQGKKLKAAAKLALCKANLRAFDPQPEPPKLLKCQTRFERAFTKAENKYGDACLALGNQVAVESVVDTYVGLLQEAVGAGNSQSEPTKCQGKKLKAAAKLALCKANLRAFDPQPEPPKLLKCQTRFVRAFAKADDKYGDDCPALGDQAAVESIVDANLARLQTAVGFRASSAP